MGTEGAGFVHLHVHTEYSLRQAACRLDELIGAAKSWGMTALAITDKEAVHGAIRFCEMAEQAGIHPVIGCEMEVDEPGESLIVLAANNRGYERILEWLNEGPDKRRSREPLKHIPHGDMIGLSGGRNGIIYRLLAEGKTQLAEAKAVEYSEAFGEGNFYVEVQLHGPEDLPIVIRAEQLSWRTGIPLVATHDVHYIHREDEKLMSLLHGKRGERNGKHIEESSGNPREGSPQAAGALYFPSPGEMLEKFRHLPEALANTAKIASRCQAAFDPGRCRFPRFAVPEPYKTAEEYLMHLCRTGLSERIARPSVDDPELRMIEARMKRELDVIISRGLASYFVIVWDIVRFARERGIPVGPGRGSATGSLVAYLLGITQVNPLAHGLSFERFLNEDRSALPDIDLDVCQIGRQELLQYVKDKYGEDRVVHIGVWTTFGTRGAVREAGKHLQLPKEHVNALAKLLPALSGRGGIRHCLQTLPELQRLPLGREPFRSLFDMAESVEGLPRNQAAHPSGIVIGPEDLNRTVPLLRRPNGVMMTAFTKDDVRKLGLLKIDLLGSRILTVIHETLRAIGHSGETLQPECIPTDDPETFRALQEGDTLGCFQLESMGIRSLLRRMKPADMEDIVALLALYRPGAGDADMAGTFLRRRLGHERVEMPAPELEPILAPTYGLVLYQEQVMQIAHTVAGYTMGEADVLRRMLIRKGDGDLQAQRQRFIRGALERGMTEARAVAVFDFLTRFVGYSFPKAHSVPYAYLSYWTAYLKTHHPTAYMASLLSLPGGYYDQKAYLRELVKMGIPLVRPDINRSGFGFCPEEEGIRVGLDAVKGAGPEAVAALIRSRSREGDFTSPADFLIRMKKCRVGRQAIQGWIASGACDGLGRSRRYMLNVLDDAGAAAGNSAVVPDDTSAVAAHDAMVPHDAGAAAGSSAVVPDDTSAAVGNSGRVLDDSTAVGDNPGRSDGEGVHGAEASPSQPEDTERDKRIMEKRALGFSLNPTPSRRWQKFAKACNIVPVDSLSHVAGRSRVRICGTVVHSRRQPAAGGEQFLSLVVQDLSGMLEVLVDPNIYKAYLYELNPNGMIIEGIVRQHDGAPRLMAERIKALPSA